MTASCSRLAFVWLASWLFFGCTSGIEVNSSRDALPESRPGFPGEDMDLFIRESGVSCEGECPSFVAGLYTIEQAWVGQSSISACSGTLVGPRLLLTNRHCIPETKRYQGAACDREIQVVFPRNRDFPQQKIGCRRVQALARDLGTVAAPDWALIELEEAPLRPVAPRPSQVSGVGLDTEVTMYSVDFSLYETRPERRGILRPIRCVANTNGVRTQNHIGPFSRLFDITDCTAKVKGGFSGSGVFNQAGHLVGLLSWAINIEDGQTTEIEELRQRYPGLRQRSGGGTTVACIEGLLVGSQDLHPDCAFPNTEAYLVAAHSFYRYRAQLRHPDYFELSEEILSALRNEDDPQIEWMVNQGQETLAEEGLVLISTPMDEAVAALWGPRVHGELIGQQRFQAEYPVVPRCVRPAQVGMDVRVPLYRLTTGREPREAVQRQPWRITYASEIENQEAHLRWFDDHYLWTVGGGVSVRVPVCPEATTLATGEDDEAESQQ